MLDIIMDRPIEIIIVVVHRITILNIGEDHVSFIISSNNWVIYTYNWNKHHLEREISNISVIDLFSNSNSGGGGGHYDSSYGGGQRQYNENNNRGGGGQRGGSNPNYRGNK